ncbi:MAG: porin family protein [Natronospirillum sp.]
MKQSMIYGIAGMLALTSATVLAQNGASGNSEEAHVYVGGSYGGFKASGGEFDDEKDFFELTFGGFFNPYVGLEASATYFGEYGGSLATADAKGYGMAIVGRLPLSDSWGIYAKGGQFFWDVDIDTPVGSTETDGNDLFYAAGMDFRLAQNLNMIVEYSRYEIDTELEDLPNVEDTDLDTVKVGLRLRF